MRILSNTIKAVLPLVILVSSVGFTYAGGQDKTVTKARSAVENAAPDDWETLAKAAEKCISKNVNMKEALDWLEKSLEIKATPYNLELKGDYYFKSKLPAKAIGFYVESMKKGKSINFNFDTDELEGKINKAQELRSKIG